MVGEAEIVVRAEEENLGSIERDPRALRPLDRAKAAMEARTPELFETALRRFAWLTITHCKWKIIPGSAGTPQPTCAPGRDTPYLAGMSAAGYEPNQEEISGLPTFWAEAPGIFTGSLIFRVGKADETLPRSGITHLVEHLAMFPVGRQAYDWGAFVDDTRTVFYARGTSSEVADFLEQTARHLHALPLARLEDERRVLRAELANHPGAHPLWRLRFGPAAFGLTAYDELGLPWLPGEEIEAWAAERFTAANAAMWFSGEPPRELELALPPGDPYHPPAAVSLPDIAFPSFACADDEQGVSLSLVAPRTTALNTGTQLLFERTQDHVRRDLGLSYGMGGSYWRLNGADAHVVLATDATPGHAGAVRDAIFEVLDEFVNDGPAPEALERHVRLAERHWLEPQNAPALLDGEASDLLAGKEREPMEALLAEVRALTPQDVASAFREATATMLVRVPNGIRVDAGRATPYADGWRSDRLEGKEFSGSDGRAGSKFVIGRLGVSQVPPNGAVVSVRYDACAATVIEGDYAVTMINTRGGSVTMEFESDEEREEIMGLILGSAPPALVARTDQDVTHRARLVHALAGEKLGGETKVRDQNLLARVLFEGEQPLTLAWGTWSGNRGLLAVTDLRLLLISADTRRILIDLTREDVDSPQPKRGLRKGGLKFRVGEDEVEISAISPQARAAEAAELLAPSPA